MAVETTMRRRSGLLVASLLAWIGLLLSATLATESPEAVTGLCRVGSGCSRVLTSRYATWGGIDLAWFGVAAYVVLVVSLTACAAASRESIYRPFRRVARATSLVACLASGVLLYLQLGVIGALCALCVSSAVVFVAIFLLVESAPRTAPGPGGASAVALVTLLALAATVLGAATVQATRRDRIVARIGGEAITEEQMRSELALVLEDQERHAYQQKVDWVRRKAVERRLAAEAARRGVTVEDLLDREVEAKIAVSEADIDAWIERSRAALETEERRARLRRSLVAQRRAELQEAFVDSLGGGVATEILLPPPHSPRVQIDTAGAATEGPPEASVRLVVFSEFECPHCAVLAPVLRRVREAHPESVSLTFMHFPIEDHEGSVEAAEAAVCAQAQGRFAAFHDRLFAARAAQQSITLEQVARDAGLDLVQFQACREGPAPAARVRHEIALARALGIREVPSLFLNGRRIGGAIDHGTLERLVEEALDGARR